jgi:preprotein translocase subunit SecG
MSSEDAELLRYISPSLVRELHCVSNKVLIVLVLLHKGRGGGLSDMFGGGVSSSLGGSSVAERNLDRLTVGIGIIWFATVIGLGMYLAYR